MVLYIGHRLLWCVLFVVYTNLCSCQRFQHSTLSPHPCTPTRFQDDAMEELDLGPNGGLIYCMEYLVDNMDWLAEQINDFGDDYLIFDCPGQVFTHSHTDTGAYT